MLHIAIVAILSLYGYKGVALPVSQTDSASTEAPLADSTKTMPRADLDSAKVVDAAQWEKTTEWKEKATIAIDILIISVCVLLLFLIYALIKLYKTRKKVFVRINRLDEIIEKQEKEYKNLRQKVNDDLANIKVQQKNTQEDWQVEMNKEFCITDEHPNKQLSKPLIENFTDYLSAGRSDVDFLLPCVEKIGAPFCVEYHKEDRSDIGTLKLLTDVSNLRTMDNVFRKNTIDMDSSNATIANAAGYIVVSNGSASFSLADQVWKIENKIKIKLVK